MKITDLKIAPLIWSTDTVPLKDQWCNSVLLINKLVPINQQILFMKMTLYIQIYNIYNDNKLIFLILHD